MWEIMKIFQNWILKDSFNSDGIGERDSLVKAHSLMFNRNFYSVAHIYRKPLSVFTLSLNFHLDINCTSFLEK